MSAPDIVRAFSLEYKIGTESSFTYFGIYFANFQIECGFLTFERSWQSVGHTVDIMFVYHSFYLEVRKVVYLPDHLSGSDILSQLCIQQSKFSYSAAVGLVKSVLALVMILFSNRASRKLGAQGLF